MASSYFIFLFYINITWINCLIFMSAVGLAESQDAAWQPGLQMPIGSFKSNPDEPGKRHCEYVQLGSFVSICPTLLGQRWNSWTAFLVKVSGHKLESSQTRVFVWFLPSLFLSTKCFSWLDSSFLVSRIFCNPLVEGTVKSMEQESLKSNWCSRIPSR